MPQRFSIKLVSNFTINIKANSLHDVKYEKRENYQSNQGYYVY